MYVESKISLNMILGQKYVSFVVVFNAYVRYGFIDV